MKITQRRTIQMGWNKVMALALLCVAALGGQRAAFAADPVITPSTVEVVPYQAGGYRYNVINYATQTTRPNIGFEQPEFNDTAWSSGQAGMGSGGYCGLQSTRHSDWPVGTEVYVRRKVMIPAGATNIRIMAAADNDILAYFDGIPLGGTITHEDCPVLDEFRLNVEPFAGTVEAGEHTLAFYIKDRGNQSFFDMRLLVDVNVSVQKMQYRLNGTGAFTDVAGALSVAEGATIEFQALPSPVGSAWPANKPVWGGSSGANGTGATKLVTFNTASASATDYKTVSAQCGNIVTANVVVVKVGKLQYRIGGQGNFADVNGDIKVALDQSVELKALPNPVGQMPWPNNKPTWSTPSGGVTGATGSGESKTISFTGNGSKTINVECGNTIPVSIIAYTVAVTIKRTGSPDNPSNATVVAAGHLSGNEHHADLVLQTTPAVAGVTFGELVISSTGQDAAGTINADASWNKVPGQSATTDGAGRITGSFTSGNRIETTTLTQNYGAGSTSVVTANQVWNELEGLEDAWTYAPYFSVGTPSDITYKMTFADGMPITAHTLTFVTTLIRGRVWNPTKEIDEDGDTIPDYIGGYDDDQPFLSSHAKMQPGGMYAGLVAYGTVSLGTIPNAGQYTGSQTINDLLSPDNEVDFYTDVVEFDVIDSDAFKDNTGS